MRIKADCGNPGLLLHKGLDFAYDSQQSPEVNNKVLEAAKKPYWDRLVEQSKSAPAGYAAFLQDITVALGPGLEFAFDQRVAVGLGIGTPGERGISLHGLFGTPVFPGSGIKGMMVREALAGLGLEQYLPDGAGDPIPWIALPNAPAEALWQMQALFGDVEGVGRLRAYDALWVPGNGPFLRRNVDTQHNRTYYGDRSAWPNDTDGPNPIHSVTLAKGIRMRFWLDAGDWTGIAYGLLERALRNRGIGAKSSAGCGRLPAPGPAPAAGPRAAPVLAAPVNPAPPGPVAEFVARVVRRQGDSVVARDGNDERLVNGAPADTPVGVELRVVRKGRMLRYVGPADA